MQKGKNMNWLGKIWIVFALFVFYLLYSCSFNASDHIRSRHSNIDAPTTIHIENKIQRSAKRGTLATERNI